MVLVIVPSVVLGGIFVMGYAFLFWQYRNFQFISFVPFVVVNGFP
jgi:hypothetical protein